MRRTLPFSAAATPGLASVGEESGTAAKPKHRRKRMTARYQGHSRQQKTRQKHFRAGIMPQPPEHQRSPQVQPPRAAYAGRLCHSPPHSPAPACRRGQRDRPPRSNQTPERRGGPPTSRANVAGGEKGNDGRCDETGFNPLAGIRSFLTKSAANRQNIVRLLSLPRPQSGPSGPAAQLLPAGRSMTRLRFPHARQTQ